GHDPDAERAQLAAEALVQWFGGRRPCRTGEARPVPPLRIGDERELRDDERRASHVEQRAIEPPLLVREDPQPRDLAREPVRGRNLVRLRDAEEHAETVVDRAAGGDPRAGDALDDGSQSLLLELADPRRVVLVLGSHRARELVMAVRLGVAALLL